MTFSAQYLDQLDEIVGGYGFGLDGTTIVRLEAGSIDDFGGISNCRTENDDDHRWLLVEREVNDGHVFFTTHPSQDDAASYHYDEQECPQFWDAEALYDLSTGDQYEVKAVITSVTWRRNYSTEYPNLWRSVSMHADRQRFADAGDSDPEPGSERGPFTAHELRFGLAAVMNIDGWKEPISHSFPELNDRERSLVSDAILYFCGSMSEIFPVDDGVRVEAPGYYVCVGS